MACLWFEIRSEKLLQLLSEPYDIDSGIFLDRLKIAYCSEIESNLRHVTLVLSLDREKMSERSGNVQFFTYLLNKCVSLECKLIIIV